MAFKRVVRLSVGSNGQGLLISGLDLDFNISRSLTFSENTAEFTIYNAKEDTRKKVLKEGNNLIFSAGYEDETIGTIFIGNIIRVINSKAEVDWVTKIYAASLRSERQTLNYITVSLTYSPGAMMSTVIKDLGAAASLVVSGAAENANFALNNGFVFAGSLRAAFDYVKNILNSKNIGIYFDNSEIVIFRQGNQDSRFGVTLLNYNNGLLNVSDITESDDPRKRISFESILIPKLQPNGLVTIQTPTLAGTFIIQSLQFSGNNYGGDFKVSGEGAA